MKAVAPVLCAVLLSCSVLFAQQPAPSGATAPPASPQENKDRTIPSFLIVGTVFNESALSLPGVQVRIRRKDEKKFRWETYTNSRGEFAVRVFPGYEYEVVTHVKKYQDQSHEVDAKADVQQRLSIKLDPVNHPGAATKP
jgi:Carboxypeptidase regulatory-like domain